MSKSLWTLLACVAIAGGAVVAIAQEGQREPQPPRRGEVAPPARAGQGAKTLDQFLISCLTTESRAEIALSRIAQQRATSKEVQAFAEQMVSDHSQFLTKLQQAAGGRGETPRTLPERQPQPGTQTPGAQTPDAGNAAASDRVGIGGQQRDQQLPPTRRPEQPGARADRTAAGSEPATVDKLMQIKDEVAERCLTSAQQLLEQKSGKEFDECYMGMQIGAHLQAADTLSVFQKHASSNLADTLQEGEKTAKQHLAKAMQIAESLRGGAAKTGTAERPGTTTKE